MLFRRCVKMFPTPDCSLPQLSMRSFLTGGEDGYVRLHHLDLDYFNTKYF